MWREFLMQETSVRSGTLRARSTQMLPARFLFFPVPVLFSYSEIPLYKFWEDFLYRLDLASPHHPCPHH